MRRLLLAVRTTFTCINEHERPLPVMVAAEFDVYITFLFDITRIRNSSIRGISIGNKEHYTTTLGDGKLGAEKG